MEVNTSSTIDNENMYDYINGFDNLDAEGVHNPFNMGHIKNKNSL